MSKPPRDVTVRFAFAAMATRRWNSSRTAVYAGATSRVNTVPDNVQQQIKEKYKGKREAILCEVFFKKGMRGTSWCESDVCSYNVEHFDSKFVSILPDFMPFI